MNLSKWHVIEGRGERILESMGEDMLQHTMLSEVEMEDFTLDVDRHNEDAWKISNAALNNAAKNNNLNKIPRIIEEIKEEDRLTIVQAYIGSLSLRRLESQLSGPVYDDYGKLARLTVIDEGVVRRRGFIEEGHGIFYIGKEKAAEPGEVFLGKIINVSSMPKLGGIIRLDNWRTTNLTGLVDSSGKPRVTLDIFAKDR